MRVRIFSFKSSYKTIAVIVISCGLAIAIGFFAGGGHYQRLISLMAFSFFVIFISLGLSDRSRYWLMAAAIPLSLVQIPHLPIPFGFSISELLLVSLGIDVLFFPNPTPSSFRLNRERFWLFSALIAFAFFSAISGIKNNETFVWHSIALMPLILFFLSSKLISSEREALIIFGIGTLTAFVYVMIMYLANTMGLSTLMPIWGSNDVGRLGYGDYVNIGPIQLSYWSTYIGTICAIAIPASITLVLRDNTKIIYKIIFTIVIVAYLISIALAASRGGAIAAITSLLFVIIISGNRGWRFLFVSSIAILLLITVLNINFQKLINTKALQRFYELANGLQNVPTFHFRIDAINISIHDLSIDPLGVGANYEWEHNRIDMINLFALIANATGILGFISFLLIILQLIRFSLIYIFSRKEDNLKYGFTTIFLGTILSGLIAGFASESVMFQPVHSMVFWGIISAAFAGMSLKPADNRI